MYPTASQVCPPELGNGGQQDALGKKYVLWDEAREDLRVNMAGAVPPGTPEALPLLGQPVGRDRNTSAVLVQVQADVGSWGHRRAHHDSCVLPWMG